MEGCVQEWNVVQLHCLQHSPNFVLVKRFRGYYSLSVYTPFLVDLSLAAIHHHAMLYDGVYVVMYVWPSARVQAYCRKRGPLQGLN